MCTATTWPITSWWSGDRRAAGQHDDLVQPAFEMHRRALDPRRTHQPGRQRLEPGGGQLVDAALDDRPVWFIWSFCAQVAML